jgi:hypothetical protein
VVRIDRVKSNHATAKTVVERLPLDEDADDESDAAADDAADESDEGRSRRGPDRSTALGSRDNFWGG